jgi:hypothetical protein
VPREYFCVMRSLGIETWKQRVFYGFVFAVGFFFQPNWFYMNFYSNPKFRDGATWVPSYEIYCVLSAFLMVVVTWTFVRFAKRIL